MSHYIYEVTSKERKQWAFEEIRCAAIGWFSRCSFWNEACKDVEGRGFQPETYEYYLEIYKLCMLWEMDEQIFRYMDFGTDRTDNEEKIEIGATRKEKEEIGITEPPSVIESPYDGSQLRRRYWKKVTEI